MRDAWRGEDACELDGACQAENRCFGGLLGIIFEAFGALGGSWEPLGSFLEPLGRHLGALGGSQAVIWVILGAARRILGPLGALLERSWSLLERPWEPLGRLLGGSWEHLGGILRQFWGDLGAWKLSLKRFIEILENHQKPCKVLQEIEVRKVTTSMRNQLGRLVGTNFGAKLACQRASWS